jgi:hypothetical protein
MGFKETQFGFLLTEILSYTPVVLLVFMSLSGPHK